VPSRFKAAQPALLYLVPACLGAALLTALREGDLRALLAYQEDDADDDEAKKAQ
jgi:minor histocompatibility antigen H13